MRFETFRISSFLKFAFICFKSQMTSTPVRAIFVDLPASEAYSLESVGKHGFGKRLQVQTQMVLKRNSFEPPGISLRSHRSGPSAQRRGQSRRLQPDERGRGPHLWICPEIQRRWEAAFFFFTYQYFRVGENFSKATLQQWKVNN